MTDEKNTQTDGELRLPSAQEMLETGVHFGHKTSRWHPKMERYIFTTKGDVHIFDLEKTVKKLEEALNFMRSVLQRGGAVILVGTKPAAKNIIKQAGQTLGLPYVSERWLGGTLTNFKTITKRLQYYRDLEEQQKTGGWEKYTKKERGQLQKRLTKLHKQLEGIKNLVKLPNAIFVTDVKVDNIAIREAKRINIPVVAICDSDANPLMVDYVIPANDDASSALKLLIETIVNNLKDVKPAAVVETQKKEA